LPYKTPIIGGSVMRTTIVLSRKHFDTKEYEKQGYEGTDINLDTALNEYGLIWKKFNRATKKGFKKGEYIFRYINNYNELDWAGNIHETTDPRKEFSWVEWQEVFDFTGMSPDEFFKQDIPYIVVELVNYYGTENVFGN
jgi:hypothetical protein